MATTNKNWRELAEQARQLQQQAEALRQEEKRMALDSILQGIQTYGIEPHELFPGINKAVRGPVSVNGTKRPAKVLRNYPTNERAQIAAKFQSLVNHGYSRERAATDVGVTTITLRKWFKDLKLAWPAAPGNPGRRPAKKAVAKKAPAKKAVAKKPAKKAA